MRTPDNGFDVWVTILGSIIFCLPPLWYLGFTANRRLGWKTDDPRTILGGILSGFAWFAFFLAWLGILRGPYFAVAALIGWFCGFWQAAGRNEVKMRFYGRPAKTTKKRGKAVR